MAYSDIKDPSAHFQTALYTGNGSAQSITNDGNSDMQPDWVWVKSRSDGGAHNVVFDSSRGVNNRLITNLTIVEDTGAGYGTVSAFNSDGFSVTNGLNTGNNTLTYVGWQWKANGGTTSTNTDGDINSTVQVNSDAGFSIVTDSPSNNTARSIGHGLGKTPTFIIRRARTRVENWRVLFDGFGTTGGINLDSDGTYNSSTTLFTGVTSTTFGVGTDFSVNGNYNYITYCFTDVQGYSKSGKYAGNGNANGPFVYTGFKPAWVIIKANSNYKYWNIFDNKRNPFNGVDKRLAPALSNAEDTVSSIEFLSNGFKIRNSGTTLNENNTNIAYFAMAENPFVAGGIPTTAR